MVVRRQNAIVMQNQKVLRPVAMMLNDVKRLLLATENRVVSRGAT
jgi:hypothetical protein